MGSKMQVLSAQRLLITQRSESPAQRFSSTSFMLYIQDGSMNPKHAIIYTPSATSSAPLVLPRIVAIISDDTRSRIPDLSCWQDP